MNFSIIVFNRTCSTYFLKRLCFRRLCICNIFSNTSFTHRYLSNDATVDNPQIKKYIESLVQEYKEISEENSLGNFSNRIIELKPIYDLHNKKSNLLDCISSLDELNTGETCDVDLKKQIEKEKSEYLIKIQELDHQLLNQLVPPDPHDFYNSIIMEISAGVGGQEAMLFTKELFEMYYSYFNYKGWTIDSYNCENSDIGGVRHATICVVGKDAHKYMKHEAGVHRVQRVPSTEKSGRLHTSTVSITVLPQPKEVDVQILDKDLKTETKRASGAGGQHVNKTESAVRLTHLPTGISVECQTDRSQIKNRQEALRKLRAILFKKQIDEQIASTLSAKKMQVQSKLRSEKIRTYNYHQDRITDHRISENIHNLSNFLHGSEMLDDLIERLEENRKQEVLSLKIEEVCS